MKLKVVVGIIIVVVVAAVIGGVKVLQIRKLMGSMASMQMPPETISSAVAKEEKWQATISAIATVTAAQGVMVAAELAGSIKEIAFESGTTVNAGDLLVKLDTSTEEAQLRSLEAQADWARITAERTKTLRTENTISQAELDSADAALKQALANADAVRAVIAKKTIRAPFAGRLGIRQVNLGEFLDVGKAIVSLQSLAPVHADFSLPQQELAQVTNGMQVRLVSDTYPGQQFMGTLTAINPQLDEATRSIRLRATFTNENHLLRPGMYARAEVLLPVEHAVTVVPATAVLNAPFGDSVYVIEPGTNSGGGLVVRQQFVRIGRMKGDYVAVDTGVKAGEKVVSSGLFKLRNGMSVVENNELTPKPSATPKPADS